MDKKTFADMVFRRKPSGVSEDCLNAAIDYFVEQNLRMEKGDVAACVMLAGRFEAFRANAQEHTGMSERRLEPLTPGMIVVSDDLTRRIASSVEHVRQELFGSTDVPFSSYEQVATWIEQQGQNQNYTLRYEDGSANGNSSGSTWVVQNPQLEQQLQAIQQQLFELHMQWSELTGEPLVLPSYPPKCRHLPYLRRENGWLVPEEFPACAGSPLAKLCEISHTLAAVTGFFQHNVVMYILMGTEPLLSPFTVRFKHTPYPTFNRVRVQAAIEIETPDITDVQWRAIHQEIRQAWGVENTTLLDEDDQRLQNIVIQLGGVPPRRGKMAFWERARQEWNRQEHLKVELKQQQGCTYKPNLHKNGKATRMRHDRLAKKLATHVSGAGEQWPSTMTLQSVTSWNGMCSRRTHPRQLSRNKTQK